MAVRLFKFSEACAIIGSRNVIDVSVGDLGDEGYIQINPADFAAICRQKALPHRTQKIDRYFWLTTKLNGCVIGCLIDKADKAVLEVINEQVPQ